jgi:hypothetical protein
MAEPTKRPLTVFLCHDSADKTKVQPLYSYLKRGGVRPWLAESELLPGQDWDAEITSALESSDVIIICLSKTSVAKEGYVQKEISFALKKALEKPEGEIFIIPAKFEECDIPARLRRYQWVDLFSEDGYKRLVPSLNLRATKLGRIAVRDPDAKETQIKSLVWAKNRIPILGGCLLLTAILLAAISISWNFIKPLLSTQSPTPRPEVLLLLTGTAIHTQSPEPIQFETATPTDIPTSTPTQTLAPDIYSIRLYNCHGSCRAYVNESDTERPTLSTQNWFDDKTVNVTERLMNGKNLMRFQVFNDLGPIAYGFQILKNDEILFDEKCGEANGVGCDNKVTWYMELKLVEEFTYELNLP